MKKKKPVIILLILAAVLVLIFLLTMLFSKGREKLVYRENLDLVAVTVEGEELTLSDLAFYVAYEEGEVQKQALIYDRDHPIRYWNIHTNDEFIRITARKAAVDMMLHDHVYAREAAEKGYSLTEEEKTLCDSAASDFWSDLGSDQKAALGISEETVYDTCRNIGLAEKYLSRVSEESGRDLALYETGGKLWEEKRDGMDIRYHDAVLSRVEMGTITVNIGNE